MLAGCCQSSTFERLGPWHESADTIGQSIGACICTLSQRLDRACCLHAAALSGIAKHAGSDANAVFTPFVHADHRLGATTHGEKTAALETSNIA